MANLTLGTLKGFLDLDDTGLEEGLAAGEEKLKGFGSKGKGLALAAGAAIATAIAGSIVAGMNVEAANDKLAASLGLTEKESARIGKAAGQVYAANYGDSLEQVNEAMGGVISSIKGMRSASDSEVKAATVNALNYAKVFDVDVSKAINSVGILTKNGLAKNTTEAFDLITAASQRVPAELREDVLDASDEYGQFFKQLGFSGKDAFAVLVEGSKKGMYGIDKAGDAIKEFTIRSTDMSTSSKGAYKAIGLDARTMANDILAGGDRAKGATDKIISGLLGIKDPAKRANAAIALFGTPLEDIGVKDIPKFLKGMQSGGKAMDGLGGSAKRMDKTLNDNAISSLGSLKRQAQVAFSSFANFALPAVNDLASALSTGLGPALSVVGGALSATAGWLKQHTTVAKALAVVIGTLVAVTAAHAAVMAVSAAGGMAAWLRGTRLISAASRVWAAVQWALNAAMSANPIVLLALALAALVAGFIIAYKKSDTFRAIVQGALHAVGAAAGWLWNNAIKPAFEGIKWAIQKVGEAGKWLWNNAIGPAFRFIMRGAAAVLTAFAAMLRGLSKVPGFGWARTAAAAMDAAAGKARKLGGDVDRIPKNPKVRITSSADLAGFYAVQKAVNNLPGRVSYVASVHNPNKHALGGPVRAGVPIMVGEFGPEIWTPPSNGQITRNHGPLGSGTGKGGGHTFQIYGQSDPAATARETVRRMQFAGVG